MIPSSLIRLLPLLALCGLTATSLAQQVCLPEPRLLTLMPMGAQAGQTVEVAVTGENVEEAKELLFSTPKITAQPKLAADGKPVLNHFMVTVAKDAPAGVFDARVMSRLGLSTARAFSTTSLPEITCTHPNTTAATAQTLALGSICNAATTRRAVDFYSFEGKKGQRVIVDCAATGIDSKLVPVVMVADPSGRDLLVNRTGGVLDFTPPADGRFLVKVHSLTFQGGPEHFYRLALVTAPAGAPVARQPSTRSVSAMSWRPECEAGLAQVRETEPNNAPAQAQKITVPCEVTGQFYPAADVDTYEFTAKKGETWCVEVASERLGLNTDPFVLVQRVVQQGAGEKLVDVAEINDIASPMKISTNGYSYDGPPYDAGSADSLGKFVAPEDGTYRLQVRDLFGGTRTDPSHVYRLIVRRPAPDFALAAWALHMTLRNGDRSALSKPVALRGGATLAFEVVAVRKDGFDGDIELSMENLPPGVTACGLKIPAGKSKGMMLITAAEGVSQQMSLARLVGRAQIAGATVVRPCSLASMTWPIVDAHSEIPEPRLLADFPVSTSGSEFAPVSIAPSESKVWEVKSGEKVSIPLHVTWRSEFAGTSIKLKAMGEGFEAAKEIEVPLNAAKCEAVLDLTTLKTPPGEYTLALYGPAVTKYRYNPGAVKAAEQEQKQAEQEALAVAEKARKLAEEAKGAPVEKKGAMENAAKAAMEQARTADATKTDAAKRMKAALETASPKDTVDIVVSEPIHLSIKPAAAK